MHPDKIKTLEQISGLKVTHHHDDDKKEFYFEFWHGGQVVKSCYTYPKARCFAEGVKFGKSLEKETN
jgi:hypothetical protein